MSVQDWENSLASNEPPDNGGVGPRFFVLVIVPLCVITGLILAWVPSCQPPPIGVCADYIYDAHYHCPEGPEWDSK